MKSMKWLEEKGENSGMRWPEVELNHRHTDFQSVDLKPQLTDIKLHTLFITSSVELM